MNIVKKTSEEWKEILHPHLTILDPDGWDRRNWQFSWYEEQITAEEFERRCGQSTTQGYIIKPSN